VIFGYPIEATDENWFHECMREILHNIHQGIQAKQALPDWPEIIPETYRDRLRNRRGLQNRLSKYKIVLEQLEAQELVCVSNALNEQNEIADLLSGRCNCGTIDDLPAQIHEPLKDLFEFAFNLLTDLKIRDHQYNIIYQKNPYQVCPFCGSEYFDASGAPREALDHYLAESKYPFAAINLFNLVPMGNKCNSKYKLAKDILRDENGTRRKAFYPYSECGVQISLEESIPFAGNNGTCPEWHISFEPTIEETVTWDSIFHIQERYKRDFLDPKFMSWLREFSSWCCSALITPISDQDIVEALERYTEHMESIGIRDIAFLKAAMFRMLLRHCKDGNERLFTLMKGVVIGGMR
jgi:hypothetical protein